MEETAEGRSEEMKLTEEKSQGGVTGDLMTSLTFLTGDLTFY